MLTPSSSPAESPSPSAFSRRTLLALTAGGVVTAISGCMESNESRVKRLREENASLHMEWQYRTQNRDLLLSYIKKATDANDKKSAEMFRYQLRQHEEILIQAFNRNAQRHNAALQVHPVLQDLQPLELINLEEEDAE